MPAAPLRAQSPGPYRDLPGDADRGVPPSSGRDQGAVQAALRRGHRGLSRLRRMARQGRRLRRPGHRRQLHRQDGRLLFQRRGPAALRDDDAAPGRGLSDPLRLAQRVRGDVVAEAASRAMQPSGFDALIGLRLSIVRRAADMLVLHFGDIRASGDGTVGAYALHVQCPWRFDGLGGTVTGRDDLWDYAGPGERPANWSYEDGRSLQDQRWSNFFARDERTQL